MCADVGYSYTSGVHFFPSACDSGMLCVFKWRTPAHIVSAILLQQNDSGILESVCVKFSEGSAHAVFLLPVILVKCVFTAGTLNLNVFPTPH